MPKDANNQFDVDQQWQMILSAEAKPIAFVRKHSGCLR
jgi:hypothetical protein